MDGLAALADCRFRGVSSWAWARPGALLNGGFDLALTLNTIVYLGCSLYGMPRLYALIFNRSS